MRKIFLPPLACIFLLLLTTDICAEPLTIPRFTWPAFQRFWNARGMPGTGLKEGRIVEHGREISLGNTLKLFVWIEDEKVRGARLRYFDPSDQHEFAMLFVKTIQSAIAVGTFRWPSDRYLEARQIFSEMQEEPLEYRFMVTVFRRSFSAEAGWEFGFFYALPEEDVSQFVWPDEIKQQ